MIFNGSDRIDNEGGDYIVLADNGMDGMCVLKQTETLEQAMSFVAAYDNCSATTVVKLVRMELSEE